MANGTTLNTGTGGNTIQDFDDGAKHWAASVVCYATSVTSGSAVLVPVTTASGLPVAQQGTWTVTANAGTGTLAVSAASLPLPSGASTAAKQAALGTAGTASADVLTIQGIASMTAVKVDGSAVTQPVSLASVPSHAVTNAGTFAVQAAQSGTWNVTTVTTLTSITNPVAATQSGTWNIGSVTTLPALVAGTALIGKVAAAQDTNTIYNGTTALQFKYAIITASASGATTVVAAVTSKKIRPLRWRASCNGAVNIKWQSHTAGDVSGLSYGTQYKDVGGGYCPGGHFETTAGEALDINLSAAVAVSGELTYIEV
jgi:hypothetical protein